jgi:phthiocerol/phenolphthiocerol synthesis type-I polyketide synthase E
LLDKGEKRVELTATTPLDDIAIIGLALRVPGARSAEAFWHNLQQGISSMREFTEAEMVAAGVDPDLLQNPKYVRFGSVLDDIDQFDARFFGYTPREAELLDPQQRLFLECAWEALEHAGYTAQDENRIGIFAGASISGYLLENLLPNPAAVRTMGMHQILLSNDKDYLTTRVSYKLNLKGPGVNVNTACSSSLVAIHLARQSLLSYESNLCLAGGVNINPGQKTGYLYQEGEIYSPDGYCRAFDAAANGTAGGSGAGIVVLKRLQEALDDRDTIYAILKGTAINNDGSFKIGFTAPSIDGQADVIAQAQAVAEVMPDEITYVETHGTGTPLGDPIEIAALTQAFRAYTDRKQYCALGSLKSSIGHLDAAAGVMGLIKTVLALYHRQLPPSLNFVQPNPQIDFAGSPFFVNTSLRAWESPDGPRRAGVSSFGIGGTNAHAILEEAPEAQTSEQSEDWQVLTLSGRTASALEAATTNLVAYLKEHRASNLASIAYTLNLGRKAFPYRRAIAAHSPEEAIAQFEDTAITAVRSGLSPDKCPQLVFMFPGQGAQYIAMAEGLYQQEPVFRQHVDHCATLLQPHMYMNICDVLYPSEIRAAESATVLEQTAITQPAIFVISYALAQLWISWGLQPAMLIGHSVGEYVAACLAGTITLEDALRLVVLRGQLIQALPSGAMLVVPLPEDQAKALISDDISIAAVNSPSHCVISGPHASVERVKQQLEVQGLTTTQLHTSHAFHSAMMDPVIEPFLAALQQISLHPPAIPFISGVTGTWITSQQATDPAYWASHLRQTVRFSDGARLLVQEADAIFLEVGPGRTLSTFIQQQTGATRRVVLNSLRHPREHILDQAFLLDMLGRLWVAGCAIDWPAVYHGQKHQRLPLPTYPFEHQSYWIAASRQQSSGPVAPASASDQETLPLHVQTGHTDQLVAPRDEIELQIARLWQSLLGFDAISIHDDFFDLGGHSLLLTQLVSRLHDEYQITLQLADIFDHRTIAQMAILVTQAQAEMMDSAALAALLDELEASDAEAVAAPFHGSESTRPSH